MGGSMLLHALPLRAAALWLCTSVALFSAVPTTKPGCANTCGNLTFSYPFGMSDDCYFKTKSNYFRIFCDSLTDPPTPYWVEKSANFTIVNISVENHEMTTTMFVANDCYDSFGNSLENNDPTLTLAEFPISIAKNKFIAVGCDTYATFTGQKGSTYTTGCLSECESISDVTYGSCSGIGCCEASIPRETYKYNISVSSFYNHVGVWGFNPCGYAFVAEEGFFNLSADVDLRKPPFDEVPIVLDWLIPGQTCEDEKKNRSTYMCQENSNCTDAKNGQGYTCKCWEGYEGNAYLQNGCRGIFSILFTRPTLDSNMFNGSLCMSIRGSMFNGSNCIKKPR